MLCFALLCGSQFVCLCACVYSIVTYTHAYTQARIHACHSLNHFDEYQLSQNFATVLDSCCLHTLNQTHRNRSITVVFLFRIFRNFSRSIIAVHSSTSSVCVRVCVALVRSIFSYLFIKFSFKPSFCKTARGACFMCRHFLSSPHQNRAKWRKIKRFSLMCSEN